MGELNQSLILVLFVTIRLARLFHYRKGRIIDLFNFYLCIPNHTRFGETIHTPTVVVIDMLN